MLSRCDLVTTKKGELRLMGAVGRMVIVAGTVVEQASRSPSELQSTIATSRSRRLQPVE
jgi:hypothetical protein